jgi:arylsulfatase A-like enzyme
MELATAFPGNTGIRPQSVTPLAEMLRLNGFSTAAFGKYHETPPWEVSVSGPLDRWPTHSGFDNFTASSVARPISGRLPFSMEPSGWNRRTIPITILLSI